MLAYPSARWPSRRSPSPTVSPPRSSASGRQLVVGLDPQPRPAAGRAARRRRALLLRDHRRGRAARGRRQAATRVLRGARAAGDGRVRRGLPLRRRAGLLVIADGKRGDIGSTARAYAEAYIDGDLPLADAMTVNPYLGRESIEPYLVRSRRNGAGVLRHRQDIECRRRRSGRRSHRRQAALAPRRRPGGRVGRGPRRRGRPVGGRSGRRRDARARRRRGAAPDAAGDPAAAGRRRAGRRSPDLSRAFQSGPASALVNASRSVIYAFRDNGGDYRAAAGAEAARLRREIWTASGW